MRQNPTPTDFQILNIVNELQSDSDAVETEEIVENTDKSTRHINRCVAAMVHPHWDGGRPWLERVHGGVTLTPDGHDVVRGERDHPYSDNAYRARVWTDAARWPWTEEQSALENVAIPHHGQRACQDAERAAWKANDHMLPRVDEISEDDMRRAWRDMLG